MSRHDFAKMTLTMTLTMTLMTSLVFLSNPQAANSSTHQITSKSPCDLTFNKLKLCGKVKWVKPPKNVELMAEKDQAELVLTLSPLSSKNSGSFKTLDLKVKPYMPTMGHGSRPTQVTRLDSSQGKPDEIQFQVKQVYLTMPGFWELRFELKDSTHTLDQSHLDYTLKADQ